MFRLSRCASYIACSHFAQGIGAARCLIQPPVEGASSSVSIPPSRGNPERFKSPGPESGGGFGYKSIGDIGALTNRARQPRPLAVLGLNAGMGSAAGANELVEIFGALVLCIKPK